MSEYEIDFSEDWDEYFLGLDNSVKSKIAKKILQLRFETYARKLKSGIPCYVAEVGQYRICYKIDFDTKVKTLYFVGKHKDYEKWLGL